MPQRPSDIAPRIERAIAKRGELIREYRTIASEAARADADYDATREAVKLKKRLIDGVRTNAEAETWATTDARVVELDTLRKVKAAEAKACLLAIDNLADETRFLNSMLVRERDEDRMHARFGQG